MATNKNANLRYHVLDKCLSNPVKKYFVNDLIDACKTKLLEINPNSKGISRRQIMDDLTYMASEEGYKAQIEHLKDGKKTYYRYTNKDFSIDQQPLNQADLEQIRAAMDILSRFEGMPQFAWVNELSPKLEQAFLMEKNASPIIGFDNNAYLEGVQHIGKLYQYILYKQGVSITYQSYRSDEPMKFILHPYYLKQYNNRWFLLGWNAKLDKMTNLALDRIKLIEEEHIPYIETTINFEEYFDDIIGVTLMEDKEKEKVILKFFPSSAPYVLSKPLHHSQKRISYANGELIISIEVILNYELESLVLGFGERVEILMPNIFRVKIAERLILSKLLYE
jgi:predicted DNA-binding transcriptional regulator YafY